jgi:hypothetical protein
MKLTSFAELKPVRDALVAERDRRWEESHAKYVKETRHINQQTKDEICSWCHGAGVVSGQGADVCCPSCHGRG